MPFQFDNSSVTVISFLSFFYYLSEVRQRQTIALKFAISVVVLQINESRCVDVIKARNVMSTRQSSGRKSELAAALKQQFEIRNNKIDARRVINSRIIKLIRDVG